ncbi:MAG: hypothetical protein JNM59_04525 [Hyphomonadaceae bacterium]|nr:hypothetical protein [Hyphomonadaceae bacterium]
MRFAAPLRPYRLARLHRGAMLWLSGFLAFVARVEMFAPLSRQAATIAHRWLDDIERLVVDIALMRGVPRLRHNVRRMHARRRPEVGFMRAVLGAKLRRRFRSRDVRQRIDALREGADVLMARLLRRLPCGLTRRRPIPTRKQAPPLAPRDSRLPTPLAANTS